MTFIYDTDYGEITKEFCDDTIYFAIADIIFDDRIYDIVKDKLTEKETPHRPKTMRRMVDLEGFEPLTSRMRTERSPN